MAFKIEKIGSDDWSLSAQLANQLIFRSNGSVMVPHQQDVDINTGKAVATVDMLPKSVGAMFEITQWMGAPDKLPRGKFALNGQHVSELLVPGLQDAIRETGQPFVTADEWRADVPANCGKFGLADGYTILPDWMGEQGGLGNLYFAGADESLRGSVVGDAIRNITGTFGDGFYSESSESVATGALSTSGNAKGKSTTASWSTVGTYVNLDASAQVPTAEENRPKTVYGTWTIQLYGNFTGPLEADPAALVSTVTGVDTRINNLEAARNTAVVTKSGHWKCGATGYTEQWGEYTNTLTHGTTYFMPFNQPFTDECVSVITYIGPTTSPMVEGSYFVKIISYNNTGMTFEYGHQMGYTRAATIRWVARGN